MLPPSRPQLIVTITGVVYALIGFALACGAGPAIPRGWISYVVVNSRGTDAERLQDLAGFGPVAVQTSKYVGEVYYNVKITDCLILRPNLQYVLFNLVASATIQMILHWDSN
jgi:hypothetical protein